MTVLDDTVTYLYVDFRVTALMKVDIKWKVEGSEKHGELNYEDLVDGVNSSRNYWYFAWYKPSGIATVNHTSKIFKTFIWRMRWE